MSKRPELEQRATMPYASPGCESATLGPNPARPRVQTRHSANRKGQIGQTRTRYPPAQIPHRIPASHRFGTATQTRTTFLADGCP